MPEYKDHCCSPGRFEARLFYHDDGETKGNDFFCIRRVYSNVKKLEESNPICSRTGLECELYLKMKEKLPRELNLAI